MRARTPLSLSAFLPPVAGPVACIGVLAVLLCGGPMATQPAAAQSAASDSGPAETPTLEMTDYGQWERLGRGVLSPDGDWMAAPVHRVNGQHELRLHHTEMDSTRVVDFGQRPSFSPDGQWLAYSIGMSEERKRALRKQEKPIRTKLGLLNVRTGDTTVVESVSDFAFSDGGRYLVMRRYPPQDAPDEMEGADLLLRDLETGTYTSFGNVADFAWQDDAPRLAMVVDGMNEAGNGVRVYHAPSGRLRPLASAPGEYTGLSWRPAGDDLAALRAREAEVWEEPNHVLLAWTELDGATATHQFDPEAVEAFPDTLRITEYRDLRWSSEGERLFFGVQARDSASTQGQQKGTGEASAAPGPWGSTRRPTARSACLARCTTTSTSSTWPAASGSAWSRRCSTGKGAAPTRSTSYG